MEDHESESVSDGELDLNRDVFIDTMLNLPRHRLNTAVRRSSIGWFRSTALTSTLAVDRTVDLLKAPSIQTFTSVKKQLDKIKFQPEWISEFLRKEGLELLFESLEQICRSHSDLFLNVILQVSCVECVRTVMDSTLSLDYIVENKEFTQKLSSGKIHIYIFKSVCTYMYIYVIYLHIYVILKGYSTGA